MRVGDGPEQNEGSHRPVDDNVEQRPPMNWSVQVNKRDSSATVHSFSGRE